MKLTLRGHFHKCRWVESDIREALMSIKIFCETFFFFFFFIEGSPLWSFFYGCLVGGNSDECMSRKGLQAQPKVRSTQFLRQTSWNVTGLCLLAKKIWSAGVDFRLLTYPPSSNFWKKAKKQGIRVPPVVDFSKKLFLSNIDFFRLITKI